MRKLLAFSGVLQIFDLDIIYQNCATFALKN